MAEGAKSKKNIRRDIKKINTKRLVKSLSENINIFKTIFYKDNTVIFREIRNIHNNYFRCCLMYIDGMVNSEITNKSIIYPIMNTDFMGEENICDLLDKIKNTVIAANNVEKSGEIDELLQKLFSGRTILLVNGFDKALMISSEGQKTRALAEPDLEKVLSGPREGFVESLTTNLSLIRQKLKTPDLKFKFKEIGIRTRTKICICYIETLAESKILTELEKRLDKINIDGILDSNYIQELIKDSPYSPLKTIGNTERPDVVVAKLLEGRVAIVVDGSPVVLTLPYVFMEYFQTADDYYHNYYFASINRLIREVGEFITISISPIYIAIVTFHQEMIPTQLLLSITTSRQGVPFPTTIEVLLLLFAFEVIREAGLRLPSAMGQSASIVGALILGQAAVEAKIFSSPVVIAVALTGITGLLNIKLKGISIIVRFIYILLASVLGLYGYIFGVIGLLVYLFSMRSFGIPYMLEYGSINPGDLKDTFIRAPWWYMSTRPKQIATKDIIRQKITQQKRI